jgi:hypothetical protein
MFNSLNAHLITRQDAALVSTIVNATDPAEALMDAMKEYSTFMEEEHATEQRIHDAITLHYDYNEHP